MRRRSGFSGMSARYATMHRDAILARMEEAWRTFRAHGPAADVAALVGRGTRSRSEWFDALAKLGRK